MSKEDFFNGVSNPRNKEVMRIFRDVEMVEALGSGILRVMKVYEYSNFIFMDNFIRINIPYYWTKEDKKEDKINDRNKLSERQQLILTLIAKNDKITIPALTRIIKVSDSTIVREIRTLTTLGYLSREGSRKGGRWKLS